MKIWGEFINNDLPDKHYIIPTKQSKIDNSKGQATQNENKQNKDTTCIWHHYAQTTTHSVNTQLVYVETDNIEHTHTHTTKTTKTQHNMSWIPLCANNHK